MAKIAVLVELELPDRAGALPTSELEWAFRLGLRAIQLGGMPREERLKNYEAISLGTQANILEVRPT